ncbi:MAG: DUF5667 domain-containing protein [Dehalococcoidia bacterium]|nr:DUF5667 domain-containing protein [Dehalococcoidia bacterium]
MKKIEEILSQCIEDVKAGNASLEGCLESYAEERRELEPLLRIALSIQEPPHVSPSDAFKIRARVNLMEHIHASRAAKRPPRSVSQAGVRQAWYAVWLKPVTIIIVAILTLSAVGVGTAYASQGSLPGDALYPVKLRTEQVQRMLTGNDVEGVKLELEFARTRLEEIGAIAHERSGKIPIAVTGYQRNLDLAIARAEQAENGGISTSMLETVALAISDHLYILDGLEDSIPEAARDSISNAVEIAIDEHVKALRIMAKQDPVRATEINLEAIQGRLDRAKVEAGRGNVRGVERAMQHFEKLRRFGEEISGVAKGMGYDTRPVDELNARATAGHLEGLGYIYGKVPGETKGAVEKAMGTSVEEYEQAVKGLQQQGSLGDIPEKPPVPDEVPDDVKKNILKPESKGSGNGRR